jgi:hypothetical protein
MLHSAFGEPLAAHDILDQPKSVTTTTNLKDNSAQPFLKTKDAQILVNDGSNDRVVIGFSPGAF